MVVHKMRIFIYLTDASHHFRFGQLSCSQPHAMKQLHPMSWALKNVSSVILLTYQMWTEQVIFSIH